MTIIQICIFEGHVSNFGKNSNGHNHRGLNCKHYLNWKNDIFMGHTQHTILVHSKCILMTKAIKQKAAFCLVMSVKKLSKVEYMSKDQLLGLLFVFSLGVSLDNSVMFEALVVILQWRLWSKPAIINFLHNVVVAVWSCYLFGMVLLFVGKDIYTDQDKIVCDNHWSSKAAITFSLKSAQKTNHHSIKFDLVSLFYPHCHAQSVNIYWSKSMGREKFAV